MQSPSSDLLRIAVLYGGDSAERVISLLSGENVAQALHAAGHHVQLIDTLHQSIDSVFWRHYDVCFIALHGGAGEDGRLQQQLTDFGVPYTGSGPEACRLAMSKSASKERFVAAGVPTASYAFIDPQDSEDSVADQAERVGYPMVVKPDNQGSSLGISVVSHRGVLSASIAEARRYDERVLIERCITGREFTISLLGREPLPLLEVTSEQTLFSYEAKYQSSATRYEFNIDLPPWVLRELELSAIAAAEAIGTAGLARVDLMLDARLRPWVLEVNTVPGMTTRSLSPRAAMRADLDLASLCQWMIADCLAVEHAA